MAQIGVVVPSPLPPGMELPDIPGLARVAEAEGLDGIWAEDVLWRGDAAVLDAGCVLAALSAATRTVEVGSAIFAPSLRNLAWALKQVATVSLLAGGRFTLGVALGSASGDEYRLAGLTRTGQRERTEQFLSVMAAWRRGDLEGDAVPSWARGLLLGAIPSPPPLWLGGTSTAALERAARFGDGWLAGAQTPEEFRAGAAQLRHMAERAQRPCPKLGIVLCASVGRSRERGLAESAALMESLYGAPPERAKELAIGGAPQQVADQIAPYLDAGAEKVAIVCASLPWAETWPMLAEVRRMFLDT